jgi:mRNA interferase MazF
MKTGDIVLIPFPFSELTQVKLRPAIVITITKDKFKDLVLCAVSSQVPAILSSVEIMINPNTTNGLRVNSVIKVDRIFTLKSEKVVAKTGELSPELLNQFKRIFQSLVE